jgi:DNA repair exonuclease SbcCD ATPase subunit
MAGEILLNRKVEEVVLEEDQEPLKILEEKVGDLLKEFQDLKKERDRLASVLEAEKERFVRMEKKLEILSQERERIKMRIDQLLYRLKGVEG